MRVLRFALGIPTPSIPRFFLGSPAVIRSYFHLTFFLFFLHYLSFMLRLFCILVGCYRGLFSLFFHSFFSIMLSLVSSILSDYSQVSFCGSRHGSDAASVFIPSFAAAYPSTSVRVGCARGVDALVRRSFPSAAVFYASMGRGALAARSARLVRAGGSERALLVAFPSSAVPPSGCLVGRSFRGGGSGSWGAVAMALGSGFPVLVWVPSVIWSPTPPLPGLSFVGSYSSSAQQFCGSWWFSPGSVVAAAPTLF